MKKEIRNSIEEVMGNPVCAQTVEKKRKCGRMLYTLYSSA